MRAIYAEAGRATSVGFRFIRRWLWTSGLVGPKPPPLPEPPAEEVIGDPTLDEGMTVRQLRKLLRA